MAFARDALLANTSIARRSPAPALAMSIDPLTNPPRWLFESFSAREMGPARGDSGVAGGGGVTVVVVGVGVGGVVDVVVVTVPFELTVIVPVISVGCTTQRNV